MPKLTHNQLIKALKKEGVASCLTLPTKEKRKFLRNLLEAVKKNDYLPFYIDGRLCQYVSLGNFLKLLLIALSEKNYQKTLPRLSSKDERRDEFLLLAVIQKQLKKLTEKKKIALVIDNIEPFFFLGSTLFLNLESLLDLFSPQLGLIFVFNGNIISLRLKKKLYGNNLIFRNIFFFPPKKIGQDEAELIFSASFDLGQRTLRLIAHRCLPRQEKFVGPVEYLEKMGLVKKRGAKFQITNLHLENLASKIAPMKENRLYLKDDKIYLNREEVSGLFSPNERRVLVKLMAKRGKILKREGIARLLWGKNWPEQYSDWAIDKVISRIRAKFERIWLERKALKTIKGKGVRLAIQSSSSQ